VDDDFDTDFGWQGNVQHALAVRYPTIQDISLSNGFESDNSKNGFANPPKTAGIFSNVTTLGPGIPGATTGDLFQAGANIRRASELKIHNSLFLHWPIGLLIEGSPSEQGAIDNLLQFRNNVVAECDVPYQLNLFGGTAVINLSQWYTDNGNETVTDASTLKLRDPYNLLFPDFSLEATSPLLTGASFSDTTFTNHPDRVAFFDAVTYRGAFGGTNWARGKWVNWNPQTTVGRTAETHPLASTRLWPNPATTSLQFRLPAAQATAIGIEVRNLTGQVIWRGTLPAGELVGQVPVADLTAGLYQLGLQLPNGATHFLRFAR
jgi:hypothetical protein